MEEQTARHVGALLTEEGYSWQITFEGERCSFDFSLPIYVGVQRSEESPEGVVCSFVRGEGDGKTVISPSVSLASLARAAVLLLPEAESFSVISAEKGGADVQDACDHLDVCGVNYTVESLDGRAYGDAVLDTVKRGCDVLILPTGYHSGGGVQIDGGETAVLTVGEGEPVRGCLASFCIDTELLAVDTACLAVGMISETEVFLKSRSYYSLCISCSEAEKFNCDIEAVSEDFRVIMVE